MQEVKMEGVLLELFTSPSCPYCPEAKRIAEKVVKQLGKVLLVHRDISVPENAELARSYGIYSVPAIAINGRYNIVGIPVEEELIHAIREEEIQMRMRQAYY